MGRKKSQSVKGAARSKMAAAFHQLKNENPAPPVAAPPQIDYEALREARKSVTRTTQWNYKPSDLVTIKAGSAPQFMATIITTAGRYATVLSPRGIEQVDFKFIRLIERYDDSCDT